MSLDCEAAWCKGTLATETWAETNNGLHSVFIMYKCIKALL